MNKHEEKKQAKALTMTILTGFAIFATLFGAGNFMFPLILGMVAGKQSLLASLGFVVTAVVLPLMGLVGSFLFEGDYKAFFYRLGVFPGAALIALCMFIIGPGAVLPRIVHLSYEMLHPFTPWMSLFIFSLLFSMITFLLTYQPTRLIDILGRYITPIKLLFVGALITLGFVKGNELLPSSLPNFELFSTAMLEGYGTLDLLGTIFFGSVFLAVIKKNLGAHTQHDVKELTKKGLYASLIGGLILSLGYIGMIFLGAYQGAGLEGLNGAQVLSAVSIRSVGMNFCLLAAIAFIIACLATMIALSTVIADYIKTELTGNKISFISSLVIVLAGVIVFSLLDLSQLMKYSIDAGFILYPVLIMLTLCNVGYKLFDFKPVKVPVAIVFAVTLFAWFGGFQKAHSFLCPLHAPAVSGMVTDENIKDSSFDGEIIDDDGASQA